MPKPRRHSYADALDSEAMLYVDPKTGRRVMVHGPAPMREREPVPARRYEPGEPLPASGTRPSNNGLDLATALGAMLGGESFLRSCEAQGSREARGRNVLPTNGTSTDEEQKVWRQLGFELGEPFKDDKLFRPVTFPPGWRIDFSQKDAHDPRHLCLYDEKNRVRAYMFYSAVFYDRDASIYFKRRYRVDYLSVHDETVRAIDARVGEDPLRDARCIFDCLEERIIERIVASRETDEPLYEYGERVRKIASDRLFELFPNASDPTAYWD